MADPASADLLHTPLDAEHVALGARMVPFAGYAMPVQYPTGILTEHLWTRERAGLFDVSHMGQAALVGPDHATTARALEALVPADIVNLAPGRQRYTQLLTEEGGILDDLMVARPANPLQDGELLLVVNASTKEADYAHMQARLPSGVELRRFDDRALLALQGPAAEAALAALAPEVATLGFMVVTQTMLAGIPAHVSRSAAGLACGRSRPPSSRR
jgi:aminomethyltransferase